jgi:Tfp pilus assembly protein PilE
MDDILKYRNFIIALVIVAVFASISMSIYSHYTDQFKALKLRREVLENGRRTIKRWNEAQKRRGQLSKIFLADDPAVFKQFVVQKAQASDIYVGAVNMSHKDEDSHWLVSLVMEAKCFYRDFIAFLGELEERKVAVESLALTNSDRPGGDDGRVNVRITLEGIVLK